MANDTIQPGGAVGVFNPEGVGGQDTSAPFNPRLFFGQGALMSSGDEAEAWVRSKLTGQPQEKIRQEINAKNAAFKAKYPVESAYQEFLGAATPSMLSTLFPPAELVSAPRSISALNALRNALRFKAEAPYASSAKIGAITGAAGGAGAAEPGFRIPGAVYGGVGGATLGLAVPVAGGIFGKVGGAALDWIRGVGPKQWTSEAERKLVEQMRSAGVTREDLMNMSREDYNNLGIPSMIAHYLPETTEAVITKGAAPQVASLEKKLIGVQRGESRRVEKKLSDKLRPGDYYADEASLTGQLRANAKNMYNDAYAYGEVNDPRIMKVLENPTFKKAFEEAQAISKTEAAAADLAGEDASQYALKQVYMPREVQPGIFEMELKDIPDVRTLDYIKRGLDAVIEKGYKGEGMSTAQANALRKLRDQYVSAIDENVPAYAAARAKYKGDLEVKEALNMGKTDFNKLNHEQVAQFMAGASDAEKEAFRTGAMRYLQNNIFDRPNAAGKIVNSDKVTKKLQAMFDDPNEYALVHAALEKEALLYQNASKALTGSRTAIKQEAKSALEKAPEDVADKVFGGTSLLGHVASLFKGDQKIPSETIGKMAEMLSKGNPQEVAAVVKALEKREKMMDLQTKTIGTAAAGTVAGSSGAQATPEISPDVSGGDVLLNEIHDLYDSWAAEHGHK